MRIRISLSIVVFSVAACGPARRPLPRPSLPAPSDHLIVRDARVGAIALGMTEADLLKYAGNPTNSLPALGAGQRSLYRYGQVVAYVTDGVVDSVGVSDPAFQMANGLHPGSSALEVKALLGQPKWQRQLNPFNLSFCFADGTEISLGDDGVKYQFSNVRSITLRGCVP